jgi:nitrogen regulatory protein P-II 1
MIRVTAYIKPHRLEPVKSAIAALGVSGMSVADVRGTGNSPEESTLLGGQGIVALPIRARIDVVAQDEAMEDIVEAIRNSAHTGNPDDGKVFVERISDAIRVRTMERGDAAV